jgi:hypothetical protein
MFLEEHREKILRHWFLHIFNNNLENTDHIVSNIVDIPIALIALFYDTARKLLLVCYIFNLHCPKIFREFRYQ